jgi:hypothetical protein
VIRSFKERRTERLFRGDTVTAFRAIESGARRKLDMLDAATRLEDLRMPPGNRLERYGVIGADNTASESTTHGAFALSGETVAPNWSRSSTTIEDYR